MSVPAAKGTDLSAAQCWTKLEVFLSLHTRLDADVQRRCLWELGGSSKKAVQNPRERRGDGEGGCRAGQREQLPACPGLAPVLGQGLHQWAASTPADCAQSSVQGETAAAHTKASLYLRLSYGPYLTTAFIFL